MEIALSERIIAMDVVNVGIGLEISKTWRVKTKLVENLKIVGQILMHQRRIAFMHFNQKGELESSLDVVTGILQVLSIDVYT